MTLNDKQLEGLNLAVSRYFEGYPYTCIAGYAGSGKTTLVSFIIAELGLEPHEVAYAAYTGKAALVLKSKGCLNAQTTHRLLYNTKMRSDGSFFHVPKKDLGDYKLIIIDEVSMLPEAMWDLLLSHKVHVIALGDPAQLPPIGEDNVKILEEPHIFLDQIMRQEEDNEIIQHSMAIRLGGALVPYEGKDVRIYTKDKVTLSMLKWADQIICAKNATRISLNHLMRKEMFGEDVPTYPVEGDKIICLKNNWDVVNALGDCLINGMTGTIHNIRIKDLKLPGLYVGKRIIADFLPDFYTEEEMELRDPVFHDIVMDYQIFETGEPTLNKKNFKRLSPFYKPEQFDYGYSVTCWKAQGCEFSKVLLFEETYPWEEEAHRRYLYTGATRSRNKLVMIMK